MTARDQRQNLSVDVQDRDIFREACSVFGDAGALTRLHAFQSDLAKQLSWLEQGLVDLALLRETAHRTVGRAGVLGFGALAEASVDLDEATGLNSNVSTAIDRWTREARRAVEFPSGLADAALQKTGRLK